MKKLEQRGHSEKQGVLFNAVRFSKMHLMPNSCLDSCTDDAQDTLFFRIKLPLCFTLDNFLCSDCNKSYQTRSIWEKILILWAQPQKWQNRRGFLAKIKMSGDKRKAMSHASLLSENNSLSNKSRRFSQKRPPRRNHWRESYRNAPRNFASSIRH